MRPTTPNLKISHTVGPTSPPQTPRTASPVFGRKSSPPLGPFLLQNPHRSMASVTGSRTAGHGHTHTHIHTGHGPNFRAIRPEQLSPRTTSSSSPSSSDSEHESIASAPRSRSATPARPEPAPPVPQARKGRTVTQADFLVEECSDFGDSDDERIGVIRPHAIEYAESDRSRSRSRNPPEIDHTIMYNLHNLNCSDDSDETDIDEAEHREFLARLREEKRRKRMSSGSIGKRTISESIGSDTDREDIKDWKSFLCSDDVGSSARRLRRRVGDRRSLQFPDPPPPRIEELEEPVSGDEELLAAAALARELPYYEYVSMEVDSPSP